MASRSLGSLTLDLIAKTGGFTAGMTAAERAANKSLTAIEKRAYAFGQALGKGLKIGASVAVAALGALTIAVGKAINDADQIRDLSIRLGTSTETLSAFGYAAQQTGTDLDALGQGMKILARNATDAQKATSEQAAIFDALGISVTDTEGKLKDLGTLIPEIATAFQGMEDGTQKTALALALFGKSGTELIEFLNQGEAGLSAFTDKARELGVVIDSETASAADDFNDTLNELKAIVSGGALTIAKELLPALKEAAQDLVKLAQEGDLAKNVAAALSGALQFGVGVLAEYNNAVERTSIAMQAFASIGEAMRKAATGGILGQLSAVQQLNGALKEGQAQLDDLIKRQNAPSFAGVSARVLGQDPTSNVNGAALNRALSGQRASGASKAKGGKSDAEREADNLQKAYDRQNESLARQIALFDQTSEAAQLSYELQNGELAKLTTAQKDALLVQAQKLDYMNQEKELGDAANMRLMEESEAISEGMKATDDLIADMEFELELIGKTNAEREKAIALRSLDANATDEQREAVAGLVDELHRAEELQGIVDDFKLGLSDAFTDFVTGAKSAKEAFGDFMDDLFKRAVQFTTDKAIDALFKAFSGTGQTGAQSGGGTDWMSLIAGLFGGGKASGGAILPGKFYRVNESGMEMATVDGRDYLMTGSKGGMITPAHKVGGGGMVVNNQFIVGPQNNQRTQEQIAQRAGFEVSQAQRRNG